MSEREFHEIDRAADRAGQPMPRGGWVAPSRSLPLIGEVPSEQVVRRPSDVEADACRCPNCTTDSISTGKHPVVRGPVQGERGELDPLDRAAMDHVEGRS